jgi:5-methylcytosine-specific restriction endonuclease McrA
MPYKTKENQHNWYVANRKRMIEKARIQYIKLTQSELIRRTKINIEWQKNNRNKVNATARRYYNRHSDRSKAATKTWKINNRERNLLINQKRRAKIAGNIIGNVPSNIFSQLWNKQGGLCSLCCADLIFEIRRPHLDHIIPLSLNGLHDESNLQLLCARCNLIKGSKHPTEFLG